ncbi:MAG: 50S ribosomal protein L15 [Candidatus Gracilibacteria bacterium]|nr:50S ribosomal protein L15 [Candidatus Gracilibacteria bacterium]
MLSLNNIKPNSGSKKTSKRLGRGNGSGKGTTAGRGMNGQNSRSGGGVGPWFEGGQTPLFRRMPKLKGFSNVNFMTKYSVVNVGDLEVLAQNGVNEITTEVLLENGLIRNTKFKVKLLGDGELSSKITVKVTKATKQAISKIENAGGKVELV